MALIVKGVCSGCQATVAEDKHGIHRASHHCARIEGNPEYQRQIEEDRKNGIAKAKDERRPLPHESLGG